MTTTENEAGCYDAHSSTLDMGMILPLTLSSGGVSLHTDRDNEDYWLEVAVDHDDLALFSFISLLEHLCYRLMDDEECAPITNADGSVRTYLVEVNP